MIEIYQYYLIEIDYQLRVLAFFTCLMAEW